MSETTGAPGAAAPAAAPAGGQLGITPPSAPPASSQPGISVSDAARLLGKQRRQGQGPTTSGRGEDAGEAAAPQGEARKPAVASRDRPSANEMAAAAKANDNTATANDNATTKPPTAPKPASALERALGVPEAAAAPPGAVPANDTTAPIIEIEGQRYSQAQLREAVLKAADYTQKMQGLAERGRQVQAQQEALATVLPYIQPELARLGQVVQHVPQRPDPALANTDPGRYIAERAAYETAMEEQQRIGGLNALQQQAHDRAMAQQVAAANEVLAQEIPFWADPQQRGQLQQEIVDWATTKGGFSRDELRGVTSPHHLKAMMKAAMYDNMMAGARTTAPPARLQAPVRGAPPPAPPSERIQQAEQAFGERPNIRSAAALLAARRGMANGGTR
jgi:hypothetical protein